VSLSHILMIPGVGGLGPALNTNPGGPFTVTTGWSNGAGTPTISVVGGNLRMTAIADGTPRIVNTGITVVVGKTYRVTWTGNTGVLRFGPSSTGAATDALISSVNASGLVDVVATATTLYLGLAKALLTGEFAELSSVAVQRVD